MNRIIVRCEVIYVSLPSLLTNGMSIPLPINNNLNNGLVYAVESFTNGTVSPNGTTIVTNIQAMYLSILEKKSQVKKLDRFPLQRLNPQNYVGQDLNFDPFEIDMQSCNITITDITGLIPGNVVMLLFYYIDNSSKS